MWLTELVVEHFRGIRHARLDLDEVTLLIGENDVGKTALFDALALVLGPWANGGPHCVATDVHRTDGATGTICIALKFAEREINAWQAPAFAPIRQMAGPQAGGLRAFWLMLRVAPDTLVPQWFCRSPDNGPAQPVSLAWVNQVRRLSPLVQIRSAAIHGLAALAPALSGAPPEVAELAAAVGRYWESLTNGQDSEAQCALEAGTRLVARLFHGETPVPDFDSPIARARVAEVLGGRRASDHAASTVPPAGAATRTIATLLVASALVHDGVLGLPPEAHPILLVEDLEAHLHPMTLAAMWSLLEPIRWQKLITTQSGELLAAAPLRALRRLTRYAGEVRVFRVEPAHFASEELRKFAYHLRVRNGVASFARCWLLVEGETEFWALSELARVLGFDFAQEGVACVEFAQCGVTPLIKVARELGIQWHVLADGDRAGVAYGEAVRRLLRDDERVAERLTLLREHDIEQCFWAHGFESVYREAAGVAPGVAVQPRRVIDRAIRRRSKPWLAFAIIGAATERGPESVPPPLALLIANCVRLAREATARGMRPDRGCEICATNA